MDKNLLRDKDKIHCASSNSIFRPNSSFSVYHDRQWIAPT